MSKPERITMHVDLQVTLPQALALKEMFEKWNRLSGIGSSNYVSFYVDGDGNFHPKIKVSFSHPLPEFTEEQLAEIHKLAPSRTDELKYDFDSIGWYLRDIDKHDFPEL